MQADSTTVRSIVISSGLVNTLAGSLSTGNTDGTGASATFNSNMPGVALDGFGAIALVVSWTRRVFLMPLGRKTVGVATCCLRRQTEGISLSAV